MRPAVGSISPLLMMLASCQLGLAEEKDRYCDKIGNKKFELHTEKKNWHQAVVYCMSQDKRLATIDSLEEHERLVGQIKKLNVTLTGRWWIGGADLGRPGDFFWYSTARRFGKFTKFRENQPDNHVYENGEDEHCMELRTEWDYDWNDFVCHYYQYYVCEYYSGSEE